MLEANYLTILMKPSYEKPVDTAQDIIDMDLTVSILGRESLVETEFSLENSLKGHLLQK